MLLTVFTNTDNNSGFTVVDITDPFSPAYCFWGWDGDYGFPSGYPIDPENYALRYYVDPEDQRPFEDLDQEVQDAIRALQDESFIDSKYALDEAWSNAVAELAGYEADEEEPSQDAQEFIKDLQTVIQEGSTKAARKMADTLSPTPGVLDGLRITLHQESLPEHCNPIIVEYFLISQDLSRRKELDLSWKQLSPAQVVQVVQAVLHHDSYQITSLNLSGNSDVTVETLSEIFKLPKASEIKRLFLFGCPKVKDINGKDMPGRIGAGEGTEVFNSYLSYQY
ncbi:hypothetical protein M407DRAFT_27127 [Tulasnella calospora MUT 4182]|uniref:Uncharacterized protein n=1 Tax=Tulasnella calospora MUT 4182 TaxID=1051891 RepID=A0A0C3KPY8_9AGAM|nr:hypothetical protein M407DRAFT_27127 [Tulasnella calospora MUT 4182]